MLKRERERQREREGDLLQLSHTVTSPLTLLLLLHLQAGHLYLRILKEKLADYLVGIKRSVQADIQRAVRRGQDVDAIDLTSETYFKKKLDQQADIGELLLLLLFVVVCCCCCWWW